MSETGRGVKSRLVFFSTEEVGRTEGGVLGSSTVTATVLNSLT
jgi:hypothetical protein